MNGQYVQCEPNPKREGELITVQLSSLWASEFARPGVPVDKMKEPSMHIQPYQLQCFEDKKVESLANMMMRSNRNLKNLKSAIIEDTLIGKANDAEVVELGDEVKCEKFDTPEKIHQGALNKKNQIAIIGFWKRDQNHEYYCYNYFYVPNPCVREYARSERNVYIHGVDSEMTKISISDVLFKGANGELFMIFNTSNIDHNSLEPENQNAWKLGVLDVEPKSETSLPLPAHHYDAEE